MKGFWKKQSEEKPLCYETGEWDGQKSVPILLCDNNGYFFVGVCYQGIMDGSEFCEFYDENGLEIDNVEYWAEIPSPFF
jgi:hypothetical protein